MNGGKVASSPFTVDMNGARQDVLQGLQAGETLTLWFSGYQSINTVTVDAAATIEESNEKNNKFTQLLAVPPAGCLQPDANSIRSLSGTGSSSRRPYRQSLEPFVFPDGRLLASGSVDNSCGCGR
jgi:hypothetical protein